MTPLKHYITLNNKKYFYTLHNYGKKATKVKCEAAKIDQEFLNENSPGLLNDLPNLILAEKKYNEQQSEEIRFRVTSKDKKRIKKIALKKGYTHPSPVSSATWHLVKPHPYRPLVRQRTIRMLDIKQEIWHKLVLIFVHF